MLSKLVNNAYLWHFIAYCLSFIGQGAISTGLGPLIPYLADKQHVLQTQYSYLFMNRAIGYVLGSILIKYIQKYLTFHKTLIIFSSFIFISLGLFTYTDSMFLQGLFIFLTYISCAVTEIVLNLSILTSNQGDDQQFYIQIGHGMFGVGGLVSPLLVLLFQQYAYFAIGSIMFTVIPCYFLLQSPESKKNKLVTQFIQVGNVIDQVKRISKRYSKRSQTKSISPMVQKAKKAILFVCFMNFIYNGEEVTYGGWISSYAVIQRVSTKQQATQLSLIYWIVMTIFRFIFAFVKIKPSIKIKILMIGQIISSIIVVMFVQLLNMKLFASYFASVMYGLTMSAMFGLLFVFPLEYGLEIKTQEVSNFLMYGELGQGTVSMFIGYLMGIFTPTMLFYSIMVIGIMLYWACQQVINTLQNNKSTDTIKQYQMSSDMNSIKNQQIKTNLI